MTTVLSHLGPSTDVPIPRPAYGPRMTLPAKPSETPREGDAVRVFCATCGHSEFVHSNTGNQRCLKTACDCNAYVVGAVPELSAQVFPS